MELVSVRCRRESDALVVCRTVVRKGGVDYRGDVWVRMDGDRVESVDPMMFVAVEVTHAGGRSPSPRPAQGGRHQRVRQPPARRPSLGAPRGGR
jgi:hypothetical protein